MTAVAPLNAHYRKFAMRKVPKVIKITMIVATLIGLWYWIICVPLLQKAKATDCQIRLRTIYQGMMLYIEDYDERLPVAKSWMTATETYIARLPPPLNHEPFYRDKSIWQCPEQGSGFPPPYGYAFNSALSAKLKSTVVSSGKVPLVFDSDNYTLNAYHGTKTLPNPPRHERFEGKQAFNNIITLGGERQWSKKDTP